MISVKSYTPRQLYIIIMVVIIDPFDGIDPFHGLCATMKVAYSPGGPGGFNVHLFINNNVLLLLN